MILQDIYCLQFIKWKYICRLFLLVKLSFFFLVIIFRFLEVNMVFNFSFFFCSLRISFFVGFLLTEVLFLICLVRLVYFRVERVSSKLMSAGDRVVIMMVLLLFFKVFFSSLVSIEFLQGIEIEYIGFYINSF